MNNGFQKKILRSALLISALFFCQGIGSCSKDVAKLCGQELPKFETEMNQGLLTLAVPPTSLQEPGRQLANQAAVSKAEQKYWKEWSELELKQIQAYLDVIELDPRLSEAKVEASHIAIDLVAFHGYAATGKRERMQSKLSQIRDGAKRVRQIACEHP